MSTITAPPQTIIDPDGDAKPMSDNTLQLRWITTIKWGIDALFRHNPDVFVAGDLLVQYRNIQLGRDSGSETEVVLGLEAGEAVVIHPGDDLPDGIEIEPVDLPVK
jgi:hypothetical protein